MTTAMSAQRRGWSFARWHALVTESRSTLGAQAGLRYASNGSTRPRPRAQMEKTLAAAWEAAAANLESKSSANYTSQNVATRVAAARRLAADEDAAHTNGRRLNDADRAVLAYAADQAVARGFLLLALPWRRVADGTGLGQRSVMNAFNRLDRSGYLKLRALGRADADPARRKASKYELMPAVRVRPVDRVPPPPGNTTMGPPALSEAFMGPPTPDGEPTAARPPFMGPRGGDLAEQFRVFVAGLAAEEIEMLRATVDAFAADRAAERRRVAS
ncbi:hypothetical protein Q6346_13505 [Isoptericola sp. b490]|uniref:hypothetical protein n=1 Tax=Actinotalea lenta TaxID=3064654 RepID=UPI0027139529|nr:hypothetical protein [Isoptericola sp. b490]MDO8122326.1 hypothetical protein [Isoptericola sp. b490]